MTNFINSSTNFVGEMMDGIFVQPLEFLYYKYINLLESIIKSRPLKKIGNIIFKKSIFSDTFTQLLGIIILLGLLVLVFYLFQWTILSIKNNIGTSEFMSSVGHLISLYIITLIFFYWIIPELCCFSKKCKPTNREYTNCQNYWKYLEPK